MVKLYYLLLLDDKGDLLSYFFLTRMPDHDVANS